MKGWKDFLREEEGAGVVEVILIIVVIVGLILIFKEQMTEIVENIFDTIKQRSKKI